MISLLDSSLTEELLPQPAPDRHPSTAGNPPARQWYATESQRAGLERLKALGDLFIQVGDRAPGGFHPLLRPLVIGETGSGKSTLVREFARRRDWAYLAVDSGSWIIQGSQKTGTLQVIRDHVRSAPRTCLFIDEICKLLPRHDANAGWYLGVFAEFLSLDGDERLRGHDWRPEDIKKFRDTCFVVAGGAFTESLREARLTAKRGGLGFGSTGASPATHSSKVAEAIPDEIFRRFNPDHVVLQSPSRDDYAHGIESIRADLGIEPTRPGKEVLDEAEASGTGVRWLTHYTTRLLLENATALPVQQSQDVHPSKVDTSFDFFSLESGHYAKEITAHSFELRAVLGRLYAEIELRRNAITKSRDAFFEAFILSRDKEGLLTLLSTAIQVSNACMSVTADDSAITDPLLRWRAMAWMGLSEFPSELARHGLLPLISKSWDLSGRVAELRSVLSHLVATGRFNKR